MIIDYPSILYFFALNNIFILALFIYQYFFHHKKWYLFVFIVGILFQTIAMILIGNRESLPFLYTVQISNFFLISSFALTSFGLISFDGKIRKKVLWLFLISTLLFYFSFLQVAENSIFRIIIQIFACSFFYGIGAILLLLNKKRYQFSIIISIALLTYSIFQLVRASILYQIGDSYNFLSGSTIDNWYFVVALFAVSTHRIGFIMLLKEMDGKTILQKNIQIQNDKLKLEELNSTKDKLFSIIAHDLRSPFNGILGFSEILIKNLKYFDIEKSEKYLGLINSSAQTTLILLDDLLDWAKLQTGQINLNPEKIILSSLIKEVINSSNSKALLKDISINTMQDEEVEIYTDKNIVMLILRNLISNAIKFTNIGGKVNIIVIANNKQVEITISDNGIGMNEEKIKTIFNISSNKTSLGTANEKGSGLGLVLCKEFVEKLGGKIWVVSEENKGSDFKFTLPINTLNK